MTGSVLRMTDTPLRRVVYTSRCLLNDAEAEAAFRMIADRARIANRNRAIVSVLFYDGGRFFQLIEGACDAVQALFERISRDHRHADLELLEDDRIPGRQFGPDSMHAFFLSDRAFDADPLLMRQRANHRKLLSRARREGGSLVETTRSMMVAFGELAV